MRHALQDNTCTLLTVSKSSQSSIVVLVTNTDTGYFHSDKYAARRVEVVAVVQLGLVVKHNVLEGRGTAQYLVEEHAWLGLGCGLG